MRRKNLVNNLIKDFRFYFPCSNDFQQMLDFTDKTYCQKDYFKLSFYDKQTAWEDYLYCRDLI